MPYTKVTAFLRLGTNHNLNTIMTLEQYHQKLNDLITTMNRTYPYPIHNARYIPTSEEDAQQAYQDLLDQSDIQSLDKQTFLRGWFALHFLGIAPHPDNDSRALPSPRRQNDGQRSAVCL